MKEMVLVVFVCVVCLVRMFIEKYNEGTLVKTHVEYKPVVHESGCSVRYMNDLSRNEILQLLGGYLFDEEEEQESLEDIKARFKQRHDDHDREEEEYILRPVVDKTDNLFSFNPGAHERLEERHRREKERAKKFREKELFENFMVGKNKLILT